MLGRTREQQLHTDRRRYAMAQDDMPDQERSIADDELVDQEFAEDEDDEFDEDDDSEDEADEEADE